MPLRRRAICGATSAINEIGPASAVEAAVSTTATSISSRLSTLSIWHQPALLRKMAVQPQERGIRYTNVRSAMAEEGVLRLLLKDESVFPEEAPLRQEEFSSPLLGRVFDRLWQLRQEGRPLSVAGLSGELSGEEMSHLTGVLQKPEATASAQRALADYIRIIREEAQKRNAQGDPLLAAQEKYKEKKGYGGKQA